MSSTPANPAAIIWAAGEYDQVGKLILPASEFLNKKLALDAGATLLDVAAGTGNLTIIAAQTGADVTALDITPELLATGREHAKAAGVTAKWIEGDAEALPFADDSFDAVASVFGVMFAPDQAKAASEMVRVCKPGGKLGICTWDPESYFGRSLSMIRKALQPDAPGAGPAAWGRSEHVAELFGQQIEFEFEYRELELRMDSVDQAQDHFERYAPPAALAKAAMGDDWPRLAGPLRELFVEGNEATDGSLLIRPRYLVATATVPAA